MTKKITDDSTKTSTALFWSRLRSGMAIMSEGFFLILFLAFMAWQFNLFPVFGKLVENRLKQIELIEEVSLNSEFRKCWPRGTCDGIVQLPIDEKQNEAIERLHIYMQVVDDYIRFDCQKNRDKGDDSYDCKSYNVGYYYGGESKN